MKEIPKIKWFGLIEGNPDNDVIRVFKDSRFLVQVRKDRNAIRLAINKIDFKLVNGEPVWEDGITWDELQEIKNLCGFRNKWLCEYYPPQEEVVNVANIRHLWVLDSPPENQLRNKG